MYKKKTLLMAMATAGLAAVFFLANTVWKQYDYWQRTTPLLEQLEESWNRVDVQPMLDQYANQAQVGWRQEAIDTLMVISTKVRSVIEQDEEWMRKQEWFDYWLETSKPEPDIRWALAMVQWGSELINALNSQIDPFSRHLPGEHLRVLRVDGNLEPYRIYVPENFDKKGRYPLVLGFHSREGNEDLFFHAFDGESLKRAAREAGFIFVGTTQGGLLGRCVKPDSKNTVKQLIAELSRQGFVDPENIFFLGHSRGSPAAVHCAIDNPGVAKAITIMAPSMSPKEFAEGAFFQSTPFFIVTASRDEHYRLNGDAMFSFIANQQNTEVQHTVVPNEDHFFTRGTDHYQLFQKIFEFFARHRSS